MLSLATDAKEYYKIKNQVIPIRHLAPELLQNGFNYTTSSDIFACGITIWEILTHGQNIPHDHLGNDELYSKLKSNSIDFKNLFKVNCKGLTNEMENVLVKKNI